MKAFTCILALAFLALAHSKTIQTKLNHNLPLESCSSSTGSFLSSMSVQLEQFPIVVADYSVIRINAKADLLKAIEEGAKVKLYLKKGFIPIACIPIGGMHIGSCTYDASWLLQKAQVCPAQCPEGQENKLPLHPGTYGGTTFEIKLGNIPEIIRPIVVGKLKLHVEVLDRNNNVLVCYNTVLAFA